jgi:hypothetical protein
VTEAIAEECGALADYLAEPSVRDPARTAGGAGGDAALRQRLEVFPALMHLVARARLDAPFPADYDLQGTVVGEGAPA